MQIALYKVWCPNLEKCSDSKILYLRQVTFFVNILEMNKQSTTVSYKTNFCWDLQLLKNCEL